ncbi:DEAD/DEAH box helicase [Amycolatopsis sp. NPDC003861]
MDIAELAHGREYEVELTPVGRPDMRGISQHAEVVLRQSRPDEPWLTCQAWDGPVRGRRMLDRALLDDLLGRERALLCWVADVPRSGLYVSIHIHVFDEAQHWVSQDRVDIAVDDKIQDDVTRRAVGTPDWSLRDPLQWLRTEFLMPPLTSASNTRLVVSGSADNSLSLHGRRYTLDVRRREDGTLFAERLTRRRPNAPHGSTVLLTAPVEFANARRAARLDAEITAQLVQIRERSRSYLDLWQHYNELEHDYVLGRAKELGTVWYTARSVNADGSWRFQVELTDEAREFLRLARIQRDGDGLELVAAADPPTFGQDDVHKTVRARGRRRAGFDLTGVPRGIDTEAMTVDLAPQKGRDDERRPPVQGYLYRAYRGDEAQIDRRRRARDRIASGQSEMEDLDLLLQGIVPPPRRHGPKHKGLSAAARHLFDDEPTDSQREALKIALNTPDIALIQGPPGTGKTQLIAALQQRLSEIGESVETVGDSLLTSFQHNAVDNVVRKIRIRGLPPSRIDSRERNRPAEVAEQWRHDTIAALRSTMPPESQAWTRVRELEDLVIGYITSPPTVTGTVTLLSEVDQLAIGMIPLALRQRVIQARDGLRTTMEVRQTRDLSMVGPVRRLVSGLRCTAEGHADDGPARAAALLRGLPDWLSLPVAGKADLAAASDGSADADLLGRLRALRDDLLDQLVGESGPVAVPAADPSVRELLEEVVAEAMTTVRESADGAHVAVSEYLDELENDPYLVERSLIEYSSVRASTCQQVDSALMRDVMRDGLVFDTVIVDEAARVNPLDLMIPLSLARRRIVLVGDHAQLPHILEKKLEDQLSQLNRTSGEQHDEDWLTLLRTSLFQRLYTLLGKARAKDPSIEDRVVRLNKQFRMHPDLGNLVSRLFYETDGPRIENGVTAAQRRHGLAKYGDRAAAWLDVGADDGADSKVGTSRARTAEASRIAREIKELAGQAPHLTFGVITFYAAQVHEIWEQLALLNLANETHGEFVPVPDLAQTPDGRERLRVGTVDAFQGSEFDVVLLSVVRSTGPDRPRRLQARLHYGHLTSRNRLCVALSRARRLLIGVGDAGMFRRPAAPPEVTPLTEFLEMCHDGNMVQP